MLKKKWFPCPEFAKQLMSTDSLPARSLSLLLMMPIHEQKVTFNYRYAGNTYYETEPEVSVRPSVCPTADITIIWAWAEQMECT